MNVKLVKILLLYLKTNVLKVKLTVLMIVIINHAIKKKWHNKIKSYLIRVVYLKNNWPIFRKNKQKEIHFQEKL